MSKLSRIGQLMIMIMTLRHSKLHMLEICGKICRIYAAYRRCIFRQIPHILLQKRSAYFKKNFPLQTSICSYELLQLNGARKSLGCYSSLIGSCILGFK